MDPRSYHQGFTRKQVLVALVLCILLAMCVAAYLSAYSDRSSGLKVNATAKNARTIHTLLSTWAQDHDGEFPTARQYSNEAFRELVKAGLTDSEKIFAIPGDAWHKNSVSGDGKGPDGIIGTAPDFAQALQRGECAYTYVSGLETTSKSDLPLIANGFSEAPGVYSKDKSQKGGIFRGEKCAWITVGGSAKVGELDSDSHLTDWRDSKKVDPFSKQWGTNPDNIKNPDG